MPEAATQTEPPRINDTELTEAEKRALLAHELNKIEGLEEEKKDIAESIKDAKKRLGNIGFSKHQVKFGLTLRKSEDAEMVEQRIAEAEVARFLGHPIGTQPELPLSVDRTPGVDKAKTDGEIAGAEGQTCHPPYAPGSPMEQSWIEGWHNGQATIASAFLKLEAKAAQEPAEEADDEDGED